MCNSGKIFNIQRFSTSDGPGIRTVVFLKGCFLDCAWCHNPESKCAKTEIFYDPIKCVGCGRCVNVCENNCQSFGDVHIFEREKCNSCGQCASVCCADALEICGEEKTAEEIIDVVLRDKPFYEESGGGITLSGGEPLMQYDFSLSLLKLAKENGLHTAIETSGFSGKRLEELIRYTDLWLYDIKLFPDDEHKKHTGVSNENIFKNLYLLDSSGANIILRCPMIPNVNLTQEHFENLSELANKLKNVIAIHLEPYHPLGLSKAKLLGKTQIYRNNKFLDSSKLRPFAEMLMAKTTKEIVII